MDTTARLNGLFPPDFTATERLTLSYGTDQPRRAPLPPREVAVADARPAQARASSEAAFFAEHGFVLLSHATRVADWEPNHAAPESCEVGSIYLAEVEAIIRERLLPGQRVEVQRGGLPLRRGRETKTPFYANGVHSDMGATPEDYQASVAAFAGDPAAQGWRRSYERDDVAGFVSIDFWRPTNMAEPLEHMPLALCDPGSVEATDLLPTAMTTIAPSGRPTHHLALRHDERQRWWWYPAMRTDEVLAFKLCEFRKDDAPGRVGNVFHSAFADPLARPDAQERQSCELRVGVLLLRD